MILKERKFYMFKGAYNLMKKEVFVIIFVFIFLVLSVNLASAGLFDWLKDFFSGGKLTGKTSHDIIVSCTDSDPSNNIYVKGQVTVEHTNSTPETFYDSCSGSELYQNYCAGVDKEAQGSSYTCPNGCSDGACISGEIACSSNSECEVKNYYTGGWVCLTNSSGAVGSYKIYVGYACVSPGTTDSFCRGTSEHHIVDECGADETCVYVGSETRCQLVDNDCTDSDNGKVFSIRGSATTTVNGTMWDFCSGNKLYEMYCSSGNILGELYSCPEVCSDGACVPNSTTTSGSQTNVSSGTNAADSSTTTTSSDTTIAPALSPATTTSSTPSSVGGYSSTVPEVAGETRTVEEEIEEGEKIIKEIRKFVDSGGREVEIESKVRIREDGSSFREEERIFKDDSGNEVKVNVEIEVKTDGSVILDENRKFINRDGNQVEIKIKIETKDAERQ